MMCVILSYNSSIFFCIETIRDVNLSPCDLDSSWLQSQAVSISLLQGEGIKKALFEYIYFPWITINKLIRFFLILSGQVRSTGQYYLTGSKTFLFIKTGSCREKETWLTRTQFDFGQLVTLLDLNKKNDLRLSVDLDLLTWVTCVQIVEPPEALWYVIYATVYK